MSDERPRAVVGEATSLADDGSPTTEREAAEASRGHTRIPTGIESTPDFASDEAAEAWIAAGRPLLEGGPSGKTGYTVADVRAAAEEG